MEKYAGIRRSATDRVIAGVCSGLATYLKLDPVLVRLIFVLLAIFGGGGLLAYIILWIVLPEEFNYIDMGAAASSGQKAFTESAGNVHADAPADEQKANSAPQQPSPQNYNAQFIGGIILITIGSLFLIASFIPRINFGDLWPILLIVAGVAILRPVFNR
jgi:phage shock protein C